MTSYHPLRWVIYSEERLYEVLEYYKKHYGEYTKMVFIPATNPLFGEDGLIYSRAAARFQHLMILDEI